MIFVLDTTAFSDLMKLHPGTQQRAGTVSPADRIVISPIVRGEVLFGIERLPLGRRRTALQERANELFGLFDPENVTPADAEHYAGVKRACELRGVVVSENDMWIAATAIRLAAVLVTRDRDQLRINEVTSEDWSAEAK